MHWKSYAAVSGATVLAGWLASAPPSNAPAAVQAPAAQRQPSADANAPTDIEMQAMRLQARLRAERAYAEPGRDPFRFAPRRQPAAPVESAEAIGESSAPPVNTAPPAPAVSLAGIAEDLVDGRTVRTAVLSSPAGVLLVREGEQILGYYRVGRIEAEAVELISLSDGTLLRLSLK
jgi:hypothetical protein